MHDALFDYEPLIRLAAFASMFVVMALWELVAPRRRQAIGRGWRWPSNLGVVAVNTLLVRILFPTTAVGLALLAEAHGFGLFNVIALPAWVGDRGLGRHPRSRDLSAACAVPCGAGAVAAAPHASCRSRIRRHHRAALPPDRNPAVDADQIRRRCRARRTAARSPDLRAPAERHIDVQPRQRAHPCGNRPRAALARGDAGHAPRAPLDPCRARPTAISASTCLGGTACSAPTARSPRPATKP